MIDYTQPLAYVGGKAPGRVVTDPSTVGVGERHGGRMCVAVVDGNYYDAEGRHCYGIASNVKNVTLPLDLTVAHQTRDGKLAKFLGKMDNGQLVFAITYRGYTGHEATELRYADGRKSNRAGVTSGDDVIVKVVEKVTYRNVYADGTIGSTAHADEDAARLRSKYGKVRVGTLKQTYHNGKLFSAVVNSSVIPWYRSASFPKGREATAEDFAR